MLINPVFDKDAWLSEFKEDYHGNGVDVEQTDTEFVLKIVGDDGKARCVEGFEKERDGVYWTGLNPEMYLRNVYEAYGYDKVMSYGVADSVDQVLSHSKIRAEFLDSAEQYVLCITPIHRENQPEHGGWRWHKWGEYIGTQNAQCEYLYDEPEVEEVVLFQFYKLSPKRNL